MINMYYIKYKFAANIESQLSQLYKLDNWHGICALLADYAVIICAIVITIWAHWFYLFSILIIASRQRALATIQHEASHIVLAKSRWVNNLLGDVFSGSLIFQGFKIYKQSHVKQHHRCLGDKNFDPDYHYHLKIGLYKSKSNTSRLKTCYDIFKNILSYVPYVIVNRLLDFKICKYSPITLLVNIFLISELVMLHCVMYYLLFWLVPFCIGFPIVGWCYARC